MARCTREHATVRRFVWTELWPVCFREPSTAHSDRYRKCDLVHRPCRPGSRSSRAYSASEDNPKNPKGNEVAASGTDPVPAGITRATLSINPTAAAGLMLRSAMTVDLKDVLAVAEQEPELAAQPEELAKIKDRLDQTFQVEQVKFELANSTIKNGREILGKEYHRLFDDLWVYAWRVMKAFIRKNMVGRIHRRYTGGPGWIPISPEDLVVLAHSEAERDALALDVITIAVPAFRRNALQRNQWSASGGASLRTWFIGTCVLSFPRAYKKWTRARGTHLREVAAGHGVDIEAVATILTDLAIERRDDLSEMVWRREQLRPLLAVAQPMTLTILGLLMQGLTHAEVADALHLTPKQIENRLRSLRQRLQRDAHRRATYSFSLLPPVRSAAR